MSSPIFPITQEVPYFLSCESSDQGAQIQSLSKRTGIPILSEASEGFCLHLLHSNALEIYGLKNPGLRVQVDFTSGEFLHRLKTSGKNQSLTKSIGVAKGLTQVLDVTGGLGGDAMVLASVGCTVTVCERHPMIALLLESALKLATAKLDFASRVHLQIVNAQDFLLSKNQEFQVIYLDPMYPIKEKSALPRKEMQILEELVGSDSDQAQLFELALSKASERVVVKRPKTAPPFSTSSHMVPTHSFEGTTTRYDMYLTKINSKPKDKI